MRCGDGWEDWKPIIWATFFFGTEATSQLLWLVSFRFGRELGVSFSGKEGFPLALAPCNRGLTSGVAESWILQGAPGGTREGIPGTLGIGNFPTAGPCSSSP